MMFEYTSRYYALETAQLKKADGDIIAYKKRRFLPRGREFSVLLNVTVGEGDRLDLITARTLGDSEQFWRVCDANEAMNPFDMTDEHGQTLRIPVPRA